MEVERKMGMMGVDQGDMAPMVEDIQRPDKAFSQKGFNKTLEYNERHNRYEDHEAGQVEHQAYFGRYS
jgi:hypothetical protein